MRLICIKCPTGCNLEVEKTKGKITVKGNLCPLGFEFAKQEITNPKRVLTTTIKSSENTFIPVKSSGEISFSKMKKAISIINKKIIDLPVFMGDVIIKNILNENVDIISCKTVLKD